MQQCRWVPETWGREKEARPTREPNRQMHLCNFRTNTTNPSVTKWGGSWRYWIQRCVRKCFGVMVTFCGVRVVTWMCRFLKTPQIVHLNAALGERKACAKEWRRTQRLGMFVGRGEGVRQPEEDQKILGDMVPPGSCALSMNTRVNTLSFYRELGKLEKSRKIGRDHSAPFYSIYAPESRIKCGEEAWVKERRFEITAVRNREQRPTRK